MFEQLETREVTNRVSVAMALGIFAAYAVGIVGAACIFIVLGERPFGIQIATAITYTYFAFWYIFFPTRGLLERYSLRNKTVQRQIPLLLAIHCAFLIPIFVGETIWFSVKLNLPSYWLTEHGKRGAPLYVWLVMVCIVFAFFIQVLICRRILSRSQRGLDESDN